MKLTSTVQDANRLATVGAADLNRRLCLLAMLATPALVRAQFRVEVSGVGANRIPIALAIFRGEAAAKRALASVVLADLEGSGQFRVAAEAESTLDETAQVDTSSWRKRGWTCWFVAVWPPCPVSACARAHA